MRHEFENSTSLRFAEYDTVDSVLTIGFQSGKDYRYADVPKDVYQELVEAKSAGKFFISCIKNNYKLVQ